ncbi:MAG: hypothetical protein R3F62_10385 [Planctomycetota bacterium]
MTLGLASGASLRGAPLALTDGVLTLSVPQTAGRGADLVYLEVARVESLRVHAADEVAHLLTFGAVDLPTPPPRDAPEAPTRLKLRRAVEALSQRAAHELGLRLELEPEFLEGLLESEAEARRVTAQVSEDVFQALQVLAADPDAQESLAPLAVVRLGAGPLAARADGDTLRITFQAALGLGGRPAPDALVDALMTAL